MSSVLTSYWRKVSQRKPPPTVAPALWIASSFALGIVAADFVRSIPQSIPLLALGAILLIVLSNSVNRLWRNVAILLAFFALGAARFTISTLTPPNHWTKLENIQSVRGVICDFPYENNGRWKATLKIISANCSDRFTPAKGKVKLFINSPSEPLAYGQLWEIDSSPYQSDYRPNFFRPQYALLLRHRGISGAIFASEDDAVLLDENRGSPIIRNVIALVRKQISKAISDALPEERAALLEGVILGGGRKLPPSIRILFSNTGVIHILAVSGLHIGIIAGALWFIFRKLLKFKSFPTAVSTILFLVGYAFLVQLRPAVLRATIMAAFVLFAPLLHRRSSIINSLASAALLILILRPTDIFSAGFQLSFAATFGIVYLLPRMAPFLGEDFLLKRSLAARAVQLFLASIAVLIAIAPISALYFYKFQLISPVANMLIVPIMTVVLSIGFVGAFAYAFLPSIGKIILLLDTLPLAYILFVVKFLGSLRFAFVPIPRLSTISILGYYILLLGLANFIWNRKLRFLIPIGMVFIAPVIVGNIIGKPSNSVVFFNLNGTAVYFADNNGNSILVSDCTSEEMTTIVLPFIYGIGKRTVDILSFPMTARNIGEFGRIQKLGLGKIMIQKNFAEMFEENLPNNLMIKEKVTIGNISIEFTSQKNCMVTLCGRRFFLFLAPPDSFPKHSVIFINFPAQLLPDKFYAIEDDKNPLLSDNIIIGKNALGWRRYLDIMGIKFYDVRKAALWIKFYTHSQLSVQQAKTFD